MESSLFSNVEVFVEELAKETNSVKVIGDSISKVAHNLNIGRITGEIKSSDNENELRLLAENRTLFISDFGFDPNESFSFPFKTISGADGRLIVSSVPDHKFTDEEKEVINLILYITDIHLGRYFAITEIEEAANKQALTGLPNATGFLSRVGRKFSNGSIDQYDSYYFNLQGYGLINKRFGQNEGDRIMGRYAAKLKQFFLIDEILGHLGGDNFVALVRKERSQEFRNYISSIEVEAVHPDGEKTTLYVPAVAGYMPIQQPIAIDRVIGGPAIALANAKRTKKRFVELTNEISDQALRAKNIEQVFDKALADGEFTVFYQPKVNSVSGEIIGAEALARWYENGRLVPPLSFVPVLEQSGKINKLDLSLLEVVCKDIHDWKILGRKTVPISVNFSRKDLADRELPKRILDIINRYEVTRDEIIIEVTETASEEEKDHMVSFLNKLKEFGIETSIDDFGTGYSSLSVLREYPIGEIKIDRSFINRQLTDTDEIIIRSIVDMARNLGIDVITEGVELVEQKNFLHKLGCDRLQGFLYDQPLPKDRFEKRLLEGKYDIR